MKIKLYFSILLILFFYAFSLQAQISDENSKVIIFIKPFKNKNNPSSDIYAAISSAFRAGLISNTKNNTAIKIKTDIKSAPVALNKIDADIIIIGNVSLVEDGLITVVINVEAIDGSIISTFSETIPLTDYKNPTMRKNFFIALGKKINEEGELDILAIHILTDRIRGNN
ncbi:hypothetical protein WAF17_16480 [Bernardetia sp. ABR2-2B]|uniref:hypothetical protein n=1 Tax=Bernardetia sp. ABR2-2B TaxID=3127472 RepID=UPI0030D40907